MSPPVPVRSDLRDGVRVDYFDSAPRAMLYAVLKRKVGHLVNGGGDLMPMMSSAPGFEGLFPVYVVEGVPEGVYG